MVFYKKDNIEISLIEEKDIDAVLKLFESFDFNVTLDTGIKPSTSTFESIIRTNLALEKKYDTVLVLKIDDVVVGYISCYLDYSRLVLGHIAVDESYQHQGYGRLLTYVAMMLAAKTNRDVSCICYHRNKYLRTLGFFSYDGIHYIFEGRLDSNDLPDVFMSIDEYANFREEEINKEVEEFSKFLESDLGQLILNLD